MTNKLKILTVVVFLGYLYTYFILKDTQLGLLFLLVFSFPVLYVIRKNYLLNPENANRLEGTIKGRIAKFLLIFFIIFILVAVLIFTSTLLGK